MFILHTVLIKCGCKACRRCCDCSAAPFHALNTRTGFKRPWCRTQAKGCKLGTQARLPSAEQLMHNLANASSNEISSRVWHARDAMAGPTSFMPSSHPYCEVVSGRRALTLKLGLAMLTCSPTADAKQLLRQCEHYAGRDCQLLKRHRPAQMGRLRRCRAVTRATAQQVAMPQRSAAMPALMQRKGTS